MGKLLRPEALLGTTECLATNPRLLTLAMNPSILPLDPEPQSLHPSLLTRIPQLQTPNPKS